MTSASKKIRSRERLGADDASRWARKMNLGNPFAKSVLRALSNYMNEDGSAFPGVATLATDTDLSEDTVVGRLRWLESIGAIAIFKCWVDDNGNRNFEGRGRVTSNEIRFLYDTTKADIEAAAADASKPKILRGAARIAHEVKEAVSPRPHGEQTEEINPRHGRELNEAGTGLATGQPPPPSPRTEELEPQEDSPLPPKGGDPDQSGNEIQERQTEKLASWAKFEAAWQEPILRQSIARGVWWALSDTEENLATDAARGYVAWRKAQKKPPNVINAHTFLRERDAWKRYAALAPELPKPPPASQPKNWIAENSDEFLALRLMFKIARLVPPEPRYDQDHRESGITFVGQIPAGAGALAALVTINPETGEVKTDGWHIVERKTPIFVAWSQRISEWTGRWPEDHRLWLDEQDNIVPSYKEAATTRSGLGKCKDGFLVPINDFPPAKGATTAKAEANEHAA